MWVLFISNSIYYFYFYNIDVVYVQYIYIKYYDICIIPGVARVKPLVNITILFVWKLIMCLKKNKIKFESKSIILSRYTDKINQHSNSIDVDYVSSSTKLVSLNLELKLLLLLDSSSFPSRVRLYIYLNSPFLLVKKKNISSFTKDYKWFDQSSKNNSRMMMSRFSSARTPMKRIRRRWPN